MYLSWKILCSETKWLSHLLFEHCCVPLHLPEISVHCVVEVSIFPNVFSSFTGCFPQMTLTTDVCLCKFLLHCLLVWNRSSLVLTALKTAFTREFLSQLQLHWLNGAAVCPSYRTSCAASHCLRIEASLPTERRALRLRKCRELRILHDSQSLSPGLCDKQFMGRKVMCYIELLRHCAGNSRAIYCLYYV